MGKGRKKRGTKSGGNALNPAPSLSTEVDGLTLSSKAEDRHAVREEEQVKLIASIAEKANNVDVEAASAADTKKNKAPLFGESSSFRAPKKSSSVPCHFFQRGYCRYGDFCCFQHLETVAGTSEPHNPAAKKASNVHNEAATCAPEECLDWYLTGSCPRSRTCRYTHPRKQGIVGSSENVRSRMAEVLLRGLSGSKGGGRDDLMEERMMNGGFTDDDIYELSLQGIKPWDPKAMDALAVLNGWDTDDDNDGLY